MLGNWLKISDNPKGLPSKKPFKQIFMLLHKEALMIDINMQGNFTSAM